MDLPLWEWVRGQRRPRKDNLMDKPKLGALKPWARKEKQKQNNQTFCPNFRG